MNPPYGYEHTEDYFRLFSNWRAESPQEIASLAVQGGVAALMERSDATLVSKQFSSADIE